MWFDALAGICAHVQRGGGGLTPSDIAPARLTQSQIDDLDQRQAIADILPLTPLQEGLLFHANSARALGHSTDLYAMQLDVTITGPLDPHRLHNAVRAVAKRHPNLVARFCEQGDQTVQVIPADAEIPWQYLGLDSEEQVQRLCAGERVAVCDLGVPPAFRVALIRTAPDEHRVVLTNHHIVLDGWSLPILLQEIFAGYLGHRLPAPGSYRRFITWLADRDTAAAHSGVATTSWPGSTPPPWSPPPADTSPDHEAAKPPPCPRTPPRPSASWRAPTTPPSTPSCKPPGHRC